MRPRKNDRSALYDNPSYRRLLQAIAFNLRALRLEREWTQEQAAERCDIAVIQYVRVETAKTNVTINTLARIADGYAVTAAELLREPLSIASASDVSPRKISQPPTLAAAEPTVKYQRRRDSGSS